MGYRLRSNTFPIKILVHMCRDVPVPVQDQRHKEEIIFRDPDAIFKEEMATFAYWDYDLKTQIEIESTIVDQSTQTHLISPIKKRQLKWRYLLRDWTLTDFDADGNPIKIEVIFDNTNRRLADEFYNEYIRGTRAVHPAILDAFMSRADQVLEMGLPPEEVNDLTPKP